MRREKREEKGVGKRKRSEKGVKDIGEGREWKGRGLKECKKI